MSQLPGFKGVSPKGIISIEKDDNGIAGLEIEGCLSINNLLVDQGKHLATGQNLLLEDPDGELQQKDAPTYQLEDTGRTYSVPELGIKSIPISMTPELPGFEFSVIGGLLFLVKSPTSENPLHTGSLFQFTFDSNTYTTPLIGLCGIDTNFIYGLPKELTSMINCFNNISSFNMELPSTANLFYNSFSNITEPIYIDVSRCIIDNNDITDTLATSFNGSTQGTIIFPESIYDHLKAMGMIVSNAGGYVLNHNTKVIAQRGVSE